MTMDAGKTGKIGYTIAELLGVDHKQIEAETKEQQAQRHAAAGRVPAASTKGVAGLFSQDKYIPASKGPGAGEAKNVDAGAGADSEVLLSNWVPPTKAVTGGSGKSGA